MRRPRSYRGGIVDFVHEPKVVARFDRASSNHRDDYQQDRRKKSVACTAINTTAAAYPLQPTRHQRPGSMGPVARQTHDAHFIVAYTAHTIQQDVDQMLPSGFDRARLKPVTVKAMYKVFSALRST
jgi:CheY-like chemotaxis protein